MKCPNCNRSVSVLTSYAHQVECDPAVAAEFAEEKRRSLARQKQLLDDALCSALARIDRLNAGDAGVKERQRKANRMALKVLRRWDELIREDAAFRSWYRKHQLAKLAAEFKRSPRQIDRYLTEK